MNTLTTKGFGILSSSLFASFFKEDMKLTERIMNTVLDGDFRVDEIREYEIDRKRFGYYHPFVLIDAHTGSGRCVIAATYIDRETEDDTRDILNWIFYHTRLERRNIYPILLSFDMTDGYLGQKAPVCVSLIESSSFLFALVVAWVRMKGGENALFSLLSDLSQTREEDIMDEDVRRVYRTIYDRSGLGEMEKMSYSMWLKSIESDIGKLGVPFISENFQTI